MELRRERRSYAEILMVSRVSKITLSRVLCRHARNQLATLELPRTPVIRDERAAPGKLLHLDINKLARYNHPRARATRDRTQRNPGAGVESLDVAIDNHRRLTFACLLPDKETPKVLTALQQAFSFCKEHGITIKRVLTDRGSTYRSRLFSQTP